MSFEPIPTDKPQRVRDGLPFLRLSETGRLYLSAKLREQLPVGFNSVSVEVDHRKRLLRFRFGKDLERKVNKEGSFGVPAHLAREFIYWETYKVAGRGVYHQAYYILRQGPDGYWSPEFVNTEGTLTRSGAAAFKKKLYPKGQRK